MNATKLLLDTCVLRELQHPKGSQRVRDALAAFIDEDLYLSVLTLGELSKGINLLPESKKRTELAIWLGKLINLPATKVLPVTKEIAVVWGRETAKANQRGRPRHAMDLMIAATGIVHGLTVCTRNEAHFIETGVRVLNPW